MRSNDPASNLLQVYRYRASTEGKERRGLTASTALAQLAQAFYVRGTLHHLVS